MLKLCVRAMDAIKNINIREEAQDGFEYLLVSGLVIVAVVAGIVSGIVPTAIAAIVTAVVNAVTAAINAGP